MTDHPITPPPKLLSDWLQKACKHSPHDNSPATIGGFMAYQAARWGADQELEACGKDIIEIIAGVFADRVIDDWDQFVELLRDGRRPKPPSLKEQALEALSSIERTAAAPVPTSKESLALIRQALEALINE